MMKKPGPVVTGPGFYIKHVYVGIFGKRKPTTHREGLAFNIPML